MKIPKFERGKFVRVTSLATIGWALILQASLVTAQTVVPPTVEDALAPDQFIVVEKTVLTPEIPPMPDIVFLADTTGSMGDALANVSANAAAVLAAVLAEQPDSQFAVSDYRDFEHNPDDGYNFQVTQPLTADMVSVIAAIGAWGTFPGAGGDEPEAQINGLWEIGTGAISFRDNSSPIVVWFGDAPGHDPSVGHFETDAIAALNAVGASVIAIDINNPGNSGLNGDAGGTVPGGQGTRITSQTDGVFLEGATSDEVAAAILVGLGNLPITVYPTPVGCDPLGVSFDPPSDTVTSGELASFTETISVPNDSSVAGQIVDCIVEFHDENGNFLGFQEITIDIPLAIELSPENEVNELSEDDSHTVTAHVTSLEVDLAGKTVNFVVGGANAGTAVPGAGTGTSPTDGNGEATFSYTVPESCNSLGTDTIAGCTDRADGGEECDLVTKDWVDTIPPEAECVPTVNPHGDNDPNAPGNGGQGQNQDGFYELLAEDNLVEDCAPLDLFVTDDGSGTVFGPFPVGTKIKYTQDPDEFPAMQPMGGNNGNGNGRGNAVDWHIWGTGDAVLTAVDQSGNVSAPVSCLVPPPPQ